MRALIYANLLLLVLLVPVQSFAAGSLKLRFLTTISADDKEGLIKSPEGVACNDQSDVVVADTGNGRLLRYTFQDRALKGGQEIKLSQVQFPVKVQFGAKNDIFVLDGKQQKVAHLNPDGSFAGFVTPYGVTNPDKYVIKSFKVDGANNIYLLDIGGERVLHVAMDGKLLGQIPFPAGFGFITDLAVTPGADVILLDSVGSRLYVAKKDATQFTPLTKDLRAYMNFASYLTTASRGGELYLLDQDGGAVVTIGPDGSFQGRQLGLGWKAGQLYYPTQVCFDKSGNVFIADRGNSRVQIFESFK
ncbi:NHL repeat domain protein [Citrifermentans bemidjiense Bem]|uniref:NHL repeat domain protein n=1 Tax=Citrifermentans bemidjiense (strain ATCC BAA-1014 / DSM 16622 / JCM 12645 / Bem) TaxID=404380 RepID=B5EH44_CITBB|nr:NHL repeat-containing protein [Citrifermentans bemidjiense]ACH38146.1 NHL repeat domain protein [Citrifermentans bemidjiense Bem]